jgi:hypothetical protein
VIPRRGGTHHSGDGVVTVGTKLHHVGLPRLSSRGPRMGTRRRKEREGPGTSQGPREASQQATSVYFWTIRPGAAVP